MSLFDFLNDSRFNPKLLKQCQELETKYKVLNKRAVVSEIRIILEGFAVCLGWNVKFPQENLDKWIRSAKITEEQKDNLIELKNFSNSTHHSELTGRGEGSDDYNKTTKAQIFVLFINTMMSVCYGKNPYKKIEEKDLLKLPYYNVGIVYKYIDDLDEEYNHFLYSYGDNRVVVRELEKPSINREQEIKDLLTRYGRYDIMSNCKLSDDIVAYNEDDRQVKVFPIAENEKSLKKYVEGKGGKLDCKTAIEIIYQLSCIVQDLLNIGNGSVYVCHRNINPRTIFVHEEEGKINVTLSCFDHAKIEKNDGNSPTALFRSDVLKHNLNSEYIYKKIITNNLSNPSITFEESKIMDIYAISKVLIYISTGQTDYNSFDRLQDYSDVFKKYIIGCLSFLNQSHTFRNTDFFGKIKSEYDEIIKSDRNNTKKTTSALKKQKKATHENNIKANLPQSSSENNDRTDEILQQIQEQNAEIHKLKMENSKNKNIIYGLIALASVLMISIAVVLFLL